MALAVVFAILTPIEGQAEGKVAGPLKDMAEGLKRAASQPATTDYLGVAATVSLSLVGVVGPSGAQAEPFQRTA